MPRLAVVLAAAAVFWIPIRSSAAAPAIRLLSTGVPSGQADGLSDHPAISADGAFVALVILVKAAAKASRR